MNEPALQSPLRQGGVSEPWGAGCRPLSILVAEDNKINQQFATLVLNKAGHSVKIAVNGRHAVDAFCRAAFDAVLMDMQMPEVDGLQATREIRALPPPKGRVPIIAVSAHEMADAKPECLAAGMDDYISKPFHPVVLLSTLARHADRSAGSVPAAPPEQAGHQPDLVSIDALPVLDLTQLDVFGTVFSQAKLRNLAGLYLIDVEARLSLIAQHRAVGDFDGVSRQAHIIVSTAGNLGAKQTSALARLLEISCAARDGTLSDQQISVLRLSCYKSSRALTSWKNAAA